MCLQTIKNGMCPDRKALHVKRQFPRKEPVELCLWGGGWVGCEWRKRRAGARWRGNNHSKRHVCVLAATAQYARRYCTRPKENE